MFIENAENMALRWLFTKLLALEEHRNRACKDRSIVMENNEKLEFMAIN